MKSSAKAVPTTIGLDIAKNFFQVHAVDAAGKVVLRRKLSRGEVLRFFEAQPKMLVGIEACGTGRYWAREIAALGHEVRLLPPTYVKPYVKRGKTDAADAEAICEAVTRPNMHFVPIKTAEQQAALMMHRPRELLVGQRTALVNALRGHLAELGIVTAKEVHRVADLLAELVGVDDRKIPPLARASLRCLAAQIEAVETQIDKLEALILEWHKGNEASQRLGQDPRCRTDHRLGGRGDDRRCLELHLRPAPVGGLGPDAEAEQQRRQVAAGRHLQGREHLPATLAVHRRDRGDPQQESARGRELAGEAARAPAGEGRRHRTGKQDRPRDLGHAA